MLNLFMPYHLKLLLPLSEVGTFLPNLKMKKLRPRGI
jgi:hypothetical protein